jgi:hypothetical protein
VIVLSVFPGIPQQVGECMLLVSGAFMLLAFILYASRYAEQLKTQKYKENINY